MLHIAICEDAPEDILMIQQLLLAETRRSHLQLHTDCFESGEALLSVIQQGASYDLLLLDIYMKQINGIDTAHEIRKLLPGIPLAFLTSSVDHTLEAFDLDALHYLLKPLRQEQVHTLLERFYDRIHRPMDLLEICSERKTYTFALQDVQKIQSCRKGVDIYLTGEAIPKHIAITFKTLEEQIDSAHFLKISRGLLVQMDYISCIDKDVCRFRDGTEALICRRERTKIKEKYNDFLFSHLAKGDRR